MNTVDAVASRAIGYIRSGMDLEAAVDRSLQEHAALGDLGQDQPSPTPISAIQSEMKTLSADVSPWLWILSVIGFIMGAMNKAEISKMYGSWKRAKQDLLG